MLNPTTIVQDTPPGADQSLADLTPVCSVQMSLSHRHVEINTCVIIECECGVSVSSSATIKHRLC